LKRFKSVKPSPLGASVKDRQEKKDGMHMLTSNPILWAYFLILSLFVIDIPKPAEGLLVEILWVLMKIYVVAIFFWTFRALVKERMRVLREDAAFRIRRQL